MEERRKSENLEKVPNQSKCQEIHKEVEDQGKFDEVYLMRTQTWMYMREPPWRLYKGRV